jgi:ADP-ribosylglycohydrolase
MIGAIIGDIAGSVYEFTGNKRLDVPLFPEGCDFTDDSIMTVATAEAVLGDGDYCNAFRKYGARYPSPMGGYGQRFGQWLVTANAPAYGSWGNGAAMRVSPIGFAFDRLDDVLKEAARSAAVTHDHPEGIKGAQATAAAIWFGRQHASKNEIRAHVTQRFGYDLSRSVDEMREHYKFNESSQKTVPEALTAFLDSHDFEDAIRIAISLGGDADTLACITGGIAEAFYSGIPDTLRLEARKRLAPALLETVDEFRLKYKEGK